MPTSKAFTRFSRKMRTKRKLSRPILQDPSTKITMSAMASVRHTNWSTKKICKRKKCILKMWAVLHDTCFWVKIQNTQAKQTKSQLKIQSSDIFYSLNMYKTYRKHWRINNTCFQHKHFYWITRIGNKLYAHIHFNVNYSEYHCCLILN